MLKKTNALGLVAAVFTALLTSGCNGGGDMSTKEVDAIKHPANSPMPKAASDLMKDHSNVKAAGAALGVPGGN